MAVGPPAKPAHSALIAEISQVWLRNHGALAVRQTMISTLGGLSAAFMARAL